MVATNHHVVRNSRYLAVQFSDGRKLIADLVVLDPEHDVAILKVNRSGVETLKPPALLPEFWRRAPSPATARPNRPPTSFPFFRRRATPAMG